MNYVVEYVRRLMRWEGDDNTTRKRDRDNLDLVEDERPALKKFKESLFLKSKFPESIMVSKENDGKDWRINQPRLNNNVRYVEIQPDDCDYFAPSTSTPASTVRHIPRMQNKSVDTRSLYADGAVSQRSNILSQELEFSPNLENREFISRNSDQNNQSFYKMKEKNKKPILIGRPCYSMSPEVVEIDDDANDDIIFEGQYNLKQNEGDFRYNLSSPKLKNANTIMHKVPTDIEQKKYTYKSQYARNIPSGVSCSSADLLSSRHGKSFTNETFKTPEGITKLRNSHNISQPVSRIAFPLRKQNSDTQLNSRFNSQNVIDQIYRLDEKKSYSELIHKFTAKNNKTPIPLTTKSLRKKLDTIDLTKGSIFKLTSSASEVNGDKEYDPFIVASIHSSDSEIELIGATDDTTRKPRKSVDRVNSFKKDLENKAVYKSNYLAELTNKYESLNSDKTRIIKDHDYKANLVTKINLQTCKNIYTDALMSKLSLKDCFVEEIKEEVVLPELTEEQQKIVSYILNAHKNPDEVIIEKFRYTIRRRDLMTLDGLNWLNDEVINFYINLLMQRSQERKNLPKVFGINTFFYPKLLSSGHAGLKRWTRNVDIFAHELMIVPVHLNVHWCVSIINFKEKSIKYYDSMGGVNVACCNALLKYLEDEHMEKKKQPLDAKNWRKECVKKIPHQMNGSDCGMFACTFAEFACRNAQMTFTQKDMPYLRRKMVIEIKEGKLML